MPVMRMRLPRKQENEKHLLYKNLHENHAGFIIQWSADIGFGEYTLYRSPDENKLEWFGDSECMDSNCDKEFLAELMKLFVDITK